MNFKKHCRHTCKQTSEMEQRTISRNVYSQAFDAFVAKKIPLNSHSVNKM